MIPNFTKEKGRKLTILILALLLSAMQIAGCRLSLEYHTSVHSCLSGVLSDWSAGIWAVVWIAEAVCGYAFFRFFFERLHYIKIRTGIVSVSNGKKAVMIAGMAAGMLLCWLPVLLSNLPGFFNYDISGQVIQVMYSELNAYNTHHTLMSTLVIGGIITLGYRIFGTLAAGVFLYSCFQMCLCAVTFAYSLWFLYKKIHRRLPVIVGFLFYAFSPTIAMFSMSTTKDVICSLFALLASLLIFELFEDSTDFFRTWKRPVMLALCCILSCLFRKNIIYAVILFAGVSIILSAEKKKTALLFVWIIAVFFMSSAALEGALDAEKGGAAEAYSVPFQQLGYLYNSAGEEAFTGEERALLDNIADRNIWEQYSPFIADNIKNYIHTDYFREHKKEFLLLWAKKGLQYPGKYGKAFLSLTYQTWYPGTSICQNEIYYFDFYGINYPIDKTTYIPALTELYRKISQDFFYQKIPVVRLLFSLGFMFWILVIALFRGIYEKQKAIVGMTLFAGCICLTCFAGPVSLVRYYLILFYAFPVYIAVLFNYNKDSYNEGECI